MNAKLRATPYYGGKSPVGTGVGAWIASHLPSRKYYVEPFCGMAGVLLAREPAHIEVLNDLDGRIICWWRAVRDEGVRFESMANATPRSRAVFDEAAKLVDESPGWKPHMDLDMELALAVHVLLSNGFSNGLGKKHRGFGTLSRPRQRLDYDALMDRLRKVTLESVDACEIVRRVGRHADAVTYCDPPYRDAITAAYGVNEFDPDALTAAMQESKGFVAVSGYGDEWDHLGWHRHERDTVAYIGARNGGTARTEVLWTNERVDADQQLSLV